MNQKINLILLSSLTLFSSFWISSCQPKATKNEYILNGSERKLSETLSIDSTVIKEVRAANKNKITSFEDYYNEFLNDELGPDSTSKMVKGFVFKESHEKSNNLIFSLKDTFKAKGYSIILLENNFNIDNKFNIIGVLKTTDQFQVLKQVGTNGINYEITNDSLLSIIKTFHQQIELELIGAGRDWCEFVIKKDSKNWKKLANEIYEVCPDIVDQGIGSVDELAEEMKKTKRLYFWWD